MKNLFKNSTLILITAILTSFTSATFTSDVYNLTVSKASRLIKSSTLTYELMSSKQKVMASFKFSYEIFSMEHNLLAAKWKQGYSINYRIDTTLNTHVEYKNGLLKLFNEFGDTKIVENRVDLDFSSLPNDLVVMNKTTSGLDALRVGYPENNNRTLATIQDFGGNILSYYIDEEVFFTETEVTRLNLSVLPPKYNTNSSFNTTMNANTNTFSTSNAFVYPNVLTSGEYFKTYGTFSFATDSLPATVKISVSSQAVIAENSKYGECRASMLTSVLVPLV